MAIILKSEGQEVKITLNLLNKSYIDGTAAPYQFSVIMGIVEDVAPEWSDIPGAPAPPGLETAPYLKGPIIILKAGGPAVLLAANERFSYPWPVIVSASSGWVQGKKYRVRVDVGYPTTGATHAYFSLNAIQMTVLVPDIQIEGMVIV